MKASITMSPLFSAGAGLYESITMDTTETQRVDYMSDKLVQDPEYRQKLLARICKVMSCIKGLVEGNWRAERVVWAA